MLKNMNLLLLNIYPTEIIEFYGIFLIDIHFKSNHQIINILYSWCNVVRKKLINTNYLQYNLQVCLRNIYKLHNVMGRLFTNFAITCFTRPGFDLSFKACNCW